MKKYSIIYIFLCIKILCNLVFIKCNSKIDNLAELRQTILEHERELDNLHGLTSNLVGETADALNFSKKRPLFSEISTKPISGVPTTTVKMTLKFPNTAPVNINQGKLREEIKNSSGTSNNIASINPIPLVVIRPDALTNLLASLSATVHQRRKIEAKKILQLEKLMSSVEKKVMKRNIKKSIRELESELAFYKADKGIAEQKS
ncbi:hypothetical protein HWI79_1487 [Cryptosporidium felis]|nr:hypothetical protein HWI79_1487 [Cryptosporidium felis]